MKKTLIIIGAILLILLIAVWVYLFMFGAPQGAKDIFSNFGTRGEPIFVDNGDDTTEDTDASIPPRPKALRQLSLRPVAGAGFSNETVRFVEQGTGHVYQIGYDGTEETLIGNTTIPQAVEAIFAPEGSRVAISRFVENTRETLVQQLGVETATGYTLPRNAREITFTHDSEELRYILAQDSSASGYAYSFSGGTSTTLFTIPLRDIRMQWGETPYVYTTPTAKQLGYVYKIRKNTLEYVTAGAYGLMPIPFTGGMAVTVLTKGKPVSSIVATSSNSLVMTIVPEKCVPSSKKEGVLYCASPKEIPDGDFPDDWYKGKVSFNDMLWSIDALRGNAMVLSDFSTESGREIDVAKMGIDPSERYIYFINKNDNTLWLFDTQIESL